MVRVLAVCLAFLSFCGTAAAADTGFRNAAANAADSGGSGNGFETYPEGAYTDGGYAPAVNFVGNGDRHRYWSYGISVPAGSTVTGIEVRLDWWLNTTDGANSLDVQLSWDGGASWTQAKRDATETTAEHTATLGGPSDTWGRSWTPAQLSNASFRVRVIANTSGTFYQQHMLEWVAVRVHYGQGGGGGTPTQPGQPASGPGGSGYAHGDLLVSQGGSGNDAWYVFQPTNPRPSSAPVAIVMHGYGEYAGFDSFYEFIRHTVRKGTVVIYPRWQTDVANPCPGPFNIEPCMTSAVNGIKGAIAWLQADPAGRVQPQLDKASYFGFSFGGIITANLANRHASLGIPVPRAMLLDDIHDGGLAGAGEPALDDSMSGIPSTLKLNCHVGAEGIISGPGMQNSSCNALYPMLGHVPTANKDLVLTYPDRYGDPDLEAGHGVCQGRPGQKDAYDFYFCWKVWDALRSCALSGTQCQYGLGGTPEHRFNGRWSDGTPIRDLKVQEAAPIAP